MAGFGAEAPPAPFGGRDGVPLSSFLVAVALAIALCDCVGLFVGGGECCCC